MKILAGDIGGTHSRFELFEAAGGRLHSLAQERFRNSGYTSFEAVLRHFLDGQVQPPNIDVACFAVAGPVSGGRSQLTNLQWRLEEGAIAAEFGFQRCFLLNDFAAIPFGVDQLNREALITLQPGQPQPDGIRLFVGAGTGLGQAVAIPESGGLRVLASEAGHADFAPGSIRQLALVSELRHELGPVSNESLLSGRGLVNIYSTLQLLGLGELESSVDITADEAAAQIAEAARAGKALPALALDYFFEMLGSYLGNAALQSLPHGGLFLAGGILPKVLDLMDREAFFRAYADKARMQELLETIPIYIILDEGVARLGAASYALSRTTN